MPLTEEQNKPRRFRFSLQRTAHEDRWIYGCYFPGTDLCVTQFGARGTGCPEGKDGVRIEWVDPVDDLPWVKNEQPD